MQNDGLSILINFFLNISILEGLQKLIADSKRQREFVVFPYFNNRLDLLRLRS